MKSKLIDSDFLVSEINTYLESSLAQGDLNPDVSWVVGCVLGELYKEVVIYTYGNQSKASRILGIHRSVYCERLKKVSRKSC